MKYTITAIRTKDLNTKSGRIWTKHEVKTEQTGDQVLELGREIENKDNIKVGDVLTAVIEKKPWTGSDGTVRYNLILNGPSLSYMYAFILSKFPEIEHFAMPEPVAPAPQPVQAPAAPIAASEVVPGVPFPTEEINPDDIPF